MHECAACVANGNIPVTGDDEEMGRGHGDHIARH